MRVNLIGSCGLVLAVSMSASLPLAQAGDRRDSARIGARPDPRFSDFVTNSPSSSARRGGIAALSVTNSDSKFSRSRSEHTTIKEKDSVPTPAKERKKITLFRFNPKFGDISVQPVLGEIKGAQVCVGF